MTDPRVYEVMRLASVLATARCRRVIANTRNVGREGIDHAERRVERCAAELQAYVESVLCPKSPTEPSSPTTS